MLSLLLAAGLLSGVLVSVARAHNDHTCYATPTHVYTSASGVYGKTNAGCGDQHASVLVSVCVQYKKADGTGECVAGTYRSINHYGEVTSGWACIAGSKDFRIRSHLQAWNASGEKVHDKGPNYSSWLNNWDCPGA
jgi:hypothetical protein